MSRGGESAEFGEGGEDFSVVAFFAHGLFLEPGDVAGLVDDDGGAAADVGFGEEEVVFLDDFALHVGEEVVGNVFSFAEGLVAPGGVDGDAEDDGVGGVELGEVGHEADVLVGAGGGRNRGG